MILFFSVTSAVCLVYWLILMLYSGFSIAQGWIWLFFAFAAIANSAAAIAYRRDVPFMTLRLLTGIHTCAFAGLVVLFVCCIVVASSLHPKEQRNPEYIVVLGAEVKNGGVISQSLKRRLDEAVLCAERNPASRFVLSGGRPDRLERSEAEYMADYMVTHGVDPKRILLEIQSKNTYENVTYSKALIDRIRRADAEEKDPRQRPARGTPAAETQILSAESRPLSVAVLTSDYHLFRARRLAARAFGFTCSGVPVKTDPILFPHFLLRECVAILKDQFLGRL